MEDKPVNPTASEVAAADKDLEYNAAVKGLEDWDESFLDTDPNANDRPKKFRSQ